MRAGSGGRLIAVAIGALGLGTLTIAGVTFREPIVEAYERWRSDYDLGIRREGSRVWLTLRNKTAKELRIFNFHTSHGWWTLTFRVRDRQGMGGEVKRRDSSDWFGFKSWYISVPPLGQLELEIDLEDGSWVIPHGIDVERETYVLKASLTIKPSQESDQLGIFVGHLESGWR